MTADGAHALLYQRVSALRDMIDYRANYEILVARDQADPERGRVYAQVRCWRPDTFSSSYDWGYGGKAYLSPHAVDSEIVQTFFGLLNAYDHHECREAFRFRGRRIYGPHIDVNALWDVSRIIDARPLPEAAQDDQGTAELDQDQTSPEQGDPASTATPIRGQGRRAHSGTAAPGAEEFPSAEDGRSPTDL